MSVIKKNIPAIGLCICAFFIHSAVGQQTVQGGVIHFRGAIVEPLCDISTHAENIDLTCLREGKKQMHRIDLRQASGLPQDIQSIATVRLHHGRMAGEVLVNVFIHIDFTHFFILSGANVAPGKSPLNPHKPINL